MDQKGSAAEAVPNSEVRRNRGGRGAIVASPQILADQLTPFQPGADYSHNITTPPPLLHTNVSSVVEF